MVRETRHLWVGNLPENIREERIREHFKRYGRVQSVKLLPRCTEEKTGEITMACTVAFMDIKSASKAHNAELKIDDRTLNTEYYEPAAIPSATASPQNTPSPYSTSPGSTRFPNGHGSTDDHGTSSFPDRCFYERSSSTSRLVGNSGGGTGTSGVVSSETAEFAGGGRSGCSRGAAPVTTNSAPTTYHVDAVSSGGGRSSSSSTSSTAPVANAAASTGRSRERTGSYRNGPYGSTAGSANATSLDGRHSSRTPATNSWGYDSARYNSTGNNQTDTGYSTAPSENNERRNSDQSSKKKTKSRSGSRSPSPSGSTSSRSPSRSRSRSSSSSSSSSMSRDTSSTGSPKSKRLTSSNTSNSIHQPVVHSDDRRPLAICVKNLPVRSSDTSLKDGLFHEYKKHGKVTWVKVVGKDAERHAIVCFKKPEDVEKALEVSYDKLFFGCKIEVAPYQGYDVEDNDLRPYEAEIDEYHPKATRTLFIGNLEKDVTASDLRKHFDQFGEIIEIDIKKQGAVSSYAFCQYSDIVSVVKAIRKMDGEHLGNNRIKLGFGKSMPYNCVWIDGINENVNEKYLKMQFEPYGVISKLHIDREKGQALIFYDQVMSAQTAVTKMRGFTLKNTKIQVDFASRECQESFFERLEKQANILDRNVFEERRDPATRTFETTAARFSSRYDTPTRPRTSSYSSRSTASVSQVTSLQSPGTPGSVTPRGTGSRSRSRFPDYYDQTQDYADRHFRSYDEYSQSSTASHEDLYDHEYGFVHDVGDPLQAMDNVVPFAPPDMRNLQKERVHLLEQLEECPSSGDELMSSKKRIKLDLLDSVITNDVIIEANRDHRKVMEVRRLSDVNLKHHSRRPSIDSGKHIRHEVVYVPHSVCKRRKTAGSDSGTKIHNFDHSGSESVGGSRPGTPLCDERPENIQPSEPRRMPREREGPLTLPLPRFASQIINRGPVSVAGIKGQKDNILSSPPPAVTSPRISNPRPPSPVHVPPPASPPPRPPSLSSNSSDSDATPPSPSLEERIKSLDEKYEKWSGSRAISAAGGDALALLDANLEKFRQRHKILDLDLKEVQPSEIVKSVMAKRSVFDEDLKRLENVGEKYEPKDFSFFPRCTLTTSTSVPVTPLQAPPLLKVNTVTPLPKMPTLLSPRSTGSSIQAAKGLQYPFPTHPPNLMSPSVVSSHPLTPPATTPSTTPLSTATTTTTTTTTVSATTVTTSSSSLVTTSRGASHGDNRLKPCPSAPSDTRTSSKMVVNKTSVVSSINSVKINENTNIPNSSEGKFVRDVKSGDKSEQISLRRDSNSSSNSPRADVKSRRNSDTSARKSSDDSDVEQINKERSLSEERKRERIEKIKTENERLEKEKFERERTEKERHEQEKQEKLRLEKERLEKERLERESELEKQRLEKERLEKERLEKENQEKLKLEKERAEKEILEKAQKEQKERSEREKQEQDRYEREKIEREKEEMERRLSQEQHQKERLEKEKQEREKSDREEYERKHREEKERKDEEERAEKAEKDKHDKDKERARHKEDNHEKRKDEHKHREPHSDTKHRENHLDKQLFDNKNTKDEKLGSRDENQICTKETHESRSSYEKKLHVDRDSERRKESIKENRDNNIHEKHKNISDNRMRDIVESRHMSIDTKSQEKHDPSKRKERNNSLPANIGSKRRFSSHETIEMCEEAKKAKLSHEHRKLSERRDSKDSTRSEDRIKSSKHKNNINKSYDKYNSSKDSEEKRKEREERHKRHKLEKQKSKSKSREKESHDSVNLQLSDKEFLNKLELKVNEEGDKHKKEKECKEKRNAIEEHEKMKKEKLSSERLQPSAEKICKSRSDPEASSRTSEEKKKRDRIRKLTNTSDSDSDEPKKHSIFDIVDDEPAYISMYDKVKARSCKNMAKLEEEKRQEKLKAKFTQLKQSRAKREEKKRSTSWDEDSDSEKDLSEIKVKRCPKVLIDSSDDESQERKSVKKKEIYSDSDSSAIYKHLKQEVMVSSEDETKNKIFKTLKSRITSDTSEDEQNKKKIISHVKSELFPDSSSTEIQAYHLTDDKSHLFKVKDEFNKIKKERRNSKHQEFELNSSIFSDGSQPEIKTEKFNNRNSFIDITTDEEVHEIVKKERSERREKKHKKKQKKQKHSVSSEESGKFDMISDSIPSENQEKSKHEKKKEHSKKEKRRDKNREGREKSKKSKKNKLENKIDIKREGKMENIFGSLSEDSENGIKEIEHEPKLPNYVEEEVQHQQVYISESDKEHENKPKEKSEREREKEEHKRKKEKKRREKERRMQEATAASLATTATTTTTSTTTTTAEQGSNDNSMDYIDMGKQVEANMMQDEGFNIMESVNKKSVPNLENTENVFNFAETMEPKKDREDKREGKEKKKKRKKSKDEKSKHHNHHHDKIKVKSIDTKKESSRSEPLAEQIVTTPTQPQNPSLPNILDEQSSINNKSLTPDFSISPLNPIISPLPKTPSSSQEKKREKLIPGFGTEIDEKIHESAVKSISEFDIPIKKEEVSIKEEEDDTASPVPDEKPRVVISQEETEDAVAALLGESFGSGKQEAFYGENSIGEPPSSLVEESNVQDDEEMRQAVQSLSAADLDVKPDTPQSEHDLQIDTDTEEQEETPLRFDSTPKAPENVEFPQRQKSPELPPYFANNIDEKQPITKMKATPNIGSPPSLTPIRSSSSFAEIRKVIDMDKRELSVKSNQQHNVSSQSWSDKKLDVPTSKPQMSVIKIETNKVVQPVSDTVLQHCSSRTYTSPPVLKIAEPQYPPLKPLSKPDNLLSPVSDISTKVTVLQTTKSSTPPQLHNLPARSPIQINKPSVSDSGLSSPRLTPALIHNRMPITSVMVSKPMQATTVMLQQSKIAHTLEPPKLVSTSDVRPQERPRMVFQNSPVQSSQFGNFGTNNKLMMQGNIRHLPPQGLLVPSRTSFNFMGNVPPSYNVGTTSHESSTENVSDSHSKVSQPLLSSVPPPLSTSHVPLPHLSIPKEVMNARPLTPKMPSPKSITNSPNPFSPVCMSPQLKNSSSPKQVSAAISPKPSTAVSPRPLTNTPTSEVISLHTTMKPTEAPVDLTPKSPLVTFTSSTPSPVIVSATSSIEVAKKDPEEKEEEKLLTFSENKVHLAEPSIQLPEDLTKSTEHQENLNKLSENPIELTKNLDNPNKLIENPNSLSENPIKFTENPTKLIENQDNLLEKPMKLAIEAVTEELNMSLEKFSPEIKDATLTKLEIKQETVPSDNNIKLEIKEELKQEHIEEKLNVASDKEIVSDMKDIEKFDEEKTETESVLSDISKERSASADILAKDDPLDTKEDSDYWSAKEAIDSVIKTLVSPDELSDHSSENGRNEWYDDQKLDESKAPEKSLLSNKDASPEKKPDEMIETKSDESENIDETVEPESSEETREPPTLRSSSRRGGRGRGRGKQPAQRVATSIERGGIQTRRGKLKEISQITPPVAKRGRGGKGRTERKSSKSESESTPTDVYEFRDEPDETSKERRPRLILTIKSPAVSNSNNTAQTTATVKEVTKDGAKEIGKEQPKESNSPSKIPENKEEFAPPSTTNTRKSRRLQERDTSKNTVDDTIEDVVKNTIQTRTTANRRSSGRQANSKQSPPPQIETPRKSPRGRKGRRGSEAADNSSSEEISKEEMKTTCPQVKITEKPKEPEKPIEIEKPVEKVPETIIKEKPHEGFKATVLRRVKGDLSLMQNPNEPTNLIDPVTGELIPMRESEEGKYVPLPGTLNAVPPKKPEDLSNKEVRVESTSRSEQPKSLDIAKSQPSVIAQPQQITVVQQKPQSLKAHVLSSQAAQAVVSQQTSTIQTKVTAPSVVLVSKSIPQETVVTKQNSPVAVSKSVSPVVITKSITPIIASKTTSPIVNTKTVTPINQHLTINTNLGMSIPTSPHLSPRPNIPINVTNKPLPKQLVKAPVLSPILMTQQKQQIHQIIQAGKQQVPKAHLTSPTVSQAQMVNTQMAHIKHQPMMKQQMMIGKGSMKPLHSQQIVSSAVPSPPLSKSQSPLNNPGRIIQGPGPKGTMDPPKVEVSMGNVLLGQRPKLSPQGQQSRIVAQTGLPLPGYEPSLHGERSFLNRSRSPPPAHQNSPSPKGEAIAHFPPGPLRPPPDLNPSHYMHPSHVMYQQYLRQQQLQHFSRSGGMEKVGDGQEGEEAPVTSPPLELRRPGSVGLALTGRNATVPHSIHSPHDRTTDSPQIGQVYNVHSPARMPYHHPRYYDQAEPPPAHRPMISIGSLAALGSDRGLAHMAPIGTPDRPLSSHSALSAHIGGLGPSDRPISTHVERPLSAHGVLGAGLGAAGNLMGAVARHIGADTPTSQRGLQAATPPHASQVPPQAESLLMLLRQYPCMWQGLLALKNDQAAVQMYLVSGNDQVAKCSLPKNTDGSTPPLRIFQRMRLEPPQVEGVARKMQMENEHCVLLALPCGHDHVDVLKQSTNLTKGFIHYLQQKQAAGIVNVAAPGTTQPPAYVVHIFPSCDFVNENLRRFAPSLLERVADIAHLLIVITTV